MKFVIMGVGGPWKSPSLMFCVHLLVVILWRRINGNFGVPDRIEQGDMKERFSCRTILKIPPPATPKVRWSKLHG